MAWIYKFRIGLITVLAIALIVLAVAFSILRAVLPHATGYLEEIEQAITSQTGLYVSIGSIDADMHWLTPRLKLLDVVAFDAAGKDELIYFDEAIFSLALIDSILNAELTLGEISLIGADIVIERYADKEQPDGRWVVQGIEVSGDGSKGISSELAAAMKNIDFLLLDSDVHWIDHKNGKEPLDFIGVNVVSKAFLGRHSVGVDLQLPVSYGDAFRFVVEVANLEDLNDLHSASWNFFLEGESINIKNWLSRLELEDMPELDGILDGKIWLRYEGRKISHVSGDVSVNAFSISNSISKNTLKGTPDRQWETDHFNAKFNLQQLLEGWRLDVTDLVLVKNGRIWGETSDITVVSNQQSGLRASATYLRLQDILQIPAVFLEVDYQSEIKDLQLAGVSGDLYNMEVVMPISEKSKTEAKGIFQDFNFTIPGSKIIVNGVDGMFRYAEGAAWLELLSDSVKIDFGDVFRQPLEASVMEGVIVASKQDDDWVLSSPDIHLQNGDVETNTRIKATVKKAGAIVIDMQTDFGHANAVSVKKYYPVSIMSNDLLDWLDNSFTDGMIESGSFILHGDVSQFPYASYDGVMEVVFNSRDLTLHFLDGWPDLEGVAGDFRFHNSSFSVENGTGRTYNGIMRQANVTIPDLMSPRLFLQGAITAPADELQQYIWNSGLDEILGAAMKQFQASGDVSLDLSLEVPLDDDRAVVETKGKISFINNELYFPVMEYSLSEVTGELSFVGNDISGSDVSASFEGAPLKINVIGNKGNASRGTLFNIQGNLPIDGLLKKFDWIPAAWVSGASDWDVSIKLPGANDQYSVKVDMLSKLDGVELDMSDALSKARNETMPVSVSIKTIDDILQANVEMSGVMRLFGTRENEGTWSFYVDSSLVKGKGEFSEDLNKDSTARLDFEHIDLLTLFKQESGDKKISLAPTFFPSLDVTADTLIWDNWKFENVHVETSWQPQGMLIHALSLRGPSVDIKGQGSWLSLEKNKHESNFKFFLSSNDYGNTLSSMGFTDSLSKGQYTGTVDWQWPAEPYGFSLGLISGSTHFEITDGQIKDVKPGAGGRMLGLLNVFKLHERLMFNFGDVYKEGLAFDSIKGDFKFSNGNAVAENIELKSPSADIGITGRIGIVKKDYDLVMLTRPHSSEALFTTGYFLAGPVISSGLVILKNLFGGDEMLRDEYTVTGSWENPQINVVSLRSGNAEKPSKETVPDETTNELP